MLGAVVTADVDHTVAGEQSRTGGEVDPVDATAGCQVMAFEGGGTPVTLAGEDDFLTGAATPTFDLDDALITQAQRSGMDAGGFP